MSLGNKNTYGNKANNFSFELRNLLLLGEINNALTAALPAPPGGLATETTLQAVLSAIDTMRDYEVRLVVDSDDPAVTWLEVRYWDAQTGALGAPQYYLPGSTTPGTPVAPISYVNQQTLLNQILAELEVISGAVHLEVDDDAITAEQELPTNINLLYGAFEGEGVEWERIQTDGNGYLKGISDVLIELGLIKTNTNDVATQTTLAALEAKLNTLGQKASAASAPVVLSTEQQVILDAIKTAVESIDADLGTGGLNLEATQLLVKGVLDTIKTDTALINSNVVLGNLTLNTIDAVLDAIKLDTANLDVALSTRASELTLLATNALLTTMDNVLDAIAVDIAAIETELLDQGTTLDAIQTATEGINTKLTSVTRTPSYTRVTGASTSSVAAGARSATFANFGNTNATVLGTTLAPGASISFSAGGEEDVLGAIAYSTLAGNTELLITTIV